jgi:hypothetical protein
MIEWVPEGQTVNEKHYLEVLTKLWEQVRKKRLELWKKKSWILHQDNAPAHSTLTAKQFLPDKCIPALEYPPCSQDLARCDFTCYPKWNIRWKDLIFSLLMRQNRKQGTCWTGCSAVYGWGGLEGYAEGDRNEFVRFWRNPDFSHQFHYFITALHICTKLYLGKKWISLSYCFC